MGRQSSPDPSRWTRDRIATESERCYTDHGAGAQRGVHVTIVVPARNDSWLVGAVCRSHYPALVRAGVEIHEFTEGLLHA